MHADASELIRSVNLHIKCLFFPMRGNTEHQWREIKPEVKRRQNHILSIRLLWQHKKHQSVREVEWERHITTNPGPEEKFTVRQAMSMVEVVPQNDKDANVKQESNDNEPLNIWFQTARLASVPSVASGESKRACRNKETSQENSWNVGVRASTAKEHSLGKDKDGQNDHVRWVNLAKSLTASERCDTEKHYSASDTYD